MHAEPNSNVRDVARFSVATWAGALESILADFTDTREVTSCNEESRCDQDIVNRRPTLTYERTADHTTLYLIIRTVFIEY